MKQQSSWENYKEHFLYPTAPLHQEDATELNVAQCDIINTFAQRVTTISNLVIGGKLGTQEGMERIKELYKTLKKTNKSFTK